MYEITAAETVPVVFGATGMTEIEQNIRFILRTMVFSVPLDRAFGGGGDMLDAPSPHAAQRRMAVIMATVEKYEPRIKALGVTFVKSGTADTMDGRLFPVLRFTLREGVSL